MKSIQLYLTGSLMWMICVAATCNNPNGVQKNPMIGQWQWVQTSFQTRGMENPEITTPVSTGVEMKVEFSSDNKVTVWHNGTVVQTCTYEVTENAEGTAFITVALPEGAYSPNIERHGILRIDKDQLEIIGGYNDAGANQQYKRL